MTGTCSHCGGALVSGQPVCTECGRPTADDRPGPGAAAEGAARPPRRDKTRDFSLVGKTIAGKYRVLDVLGQGGFGTVYLVEITAGMVGEKLALKILPEELSAQPTFREQFLNEIRTAMRVVDRYIVQIRDVGVTDEGLLYYTMDFSPGITLAEVIRREGRLPVPRAILIVLNVLRALQTAHAAGIIHRDLKPANIMVENQGGKESVRVVDFGIATAVRADRGRTKGLAGSPHYMPPEQFMGAEIGFYSDIYPLGVTLYECLTGRKPYLVGSSPQEVFRALKAGPPAPPETHHPGIAEYPGLSGIILRAMERNPERRFQSAKELFDALNAILVRGTAVEEHAAPRAAAGGAPVRPPPQPRPRRRRRVARKSEPMELAGLLIVVLAIIAGATVFRDEIAALFSSRPESAGAPPKAPEEPEPEPQPTAPVARARAEKRPEPPRMSTEPTLEERKKEAEAALTAEASKALEEAQSAFQAKRWPIAIDRAEAVLAMRPGMLEAHRIRGLACLRAGDATAAVSSLGIVHAAAPPEKPDGEVLLALAEAKLGLSPPRPDQAEEHARAALKDDPKNPKAVLLFAKALGLNGKEELMKKVIGAAKKGKVESPEIDALWQELFVDLPRKRASEAARIAAEAREAADSGDRLRASELAVEWVRMEPSGEARVFAAEAHLDAGKTGEAKAVLEEALAGSAPDDGSGPPGTPGTTDADTKRLEALLHVCEGRVALEADAKDHARTARAEEAFGKALVALAAQGPSASKKHQALARLGLARAQALSGAVDGALEAVKPLAGNLGPDLLLEEGRVLLFAGQKAEEKGPKLKAFGAAKKSLLAVQRQKPSDRARREGHYVSGLVNLEIGDWEGKDSGYRAAVESFAAAKAAGLDSVELYESWSFAYDRLGQLQKAAQTLRTAFEKEPTPERCLRAAELHLKANPRSTDAVEILKMGTEKFPGDQVIIRKYLELTG